MSRKKYIIGTFYGGYLSEDDSVYDILIKIRGSFNLTRDEIDNWKQNNPELLNKKCNRTDIIVNTLCEMKNWEVVSVAKHCDNSGYNFVTITFSFFDTDTIKI